MQRSPARSRPRTRLLAIAACAGALLAAAATAGAEEVAVPAPTPTREAIARPGAFCTAASCRPRSASLLTGAAFGATVLAIGWQARRRESREP